MSTPRAQLDEKLLHKLWFESAWMAWPGMHGGHVMAVSARVAAGLAVDLPLRVISTRFLHRLEPSAVIAEAMVEQASRSTMTVSVRLLQEGRTAAISTCTFAAPGGDLAVEGRRAPAVPEPATRAVFRDAELLFPFASKLEIRPATDTLPLSGAEEAELTAWLRLHEPDRSMETVLTLADAMPPAIYALLKLPVPVPSMEITVHLAEPSSSPDPYDGWLLARQRNVRTSAGLSIDECDLWDEEGKLIAQTRQLRRVLGSAVVPSQALAGGQE